MVAKGLFAPISLGPTVEITAFTLTGISTLVVLIRFSCRIWVVGRLKVYDYLIAAALFCMWGLCVINHYQIYYGTGTGQWPANLPPPTPESIRRAKINSAIVWYVYQVAYLFVPAFVKLSVLVFYLSIATDRIFRNLTYATIVFVASFTLVMVLVNAFECPHKPSLVVEEDIFRKRIEWKCFDLVRLYYSQASLNLLSDVIILLLPLPTLIRLRMPTLKRLCLLMVFSVGLLVPVAAAFRIWALHLWSGSGPVDSRYYGGYIIFWDQVELNTAIICASAPSLQPLFKRVFGELARFSRGRSAYYFYGYGDGQNTMTQITIGRRGSRPFNQAVDLETPPATFYPQKQSIERVESDVILVQEVDQEEEIRSRVRAFAARPQSVYSHPPKSPARPQDFLSDG